MAPREDPPRLLPANLAERAESADSWTGLFHEALQEQHVRVRRFLDAHRQRWKEVESQLCRQIEELEAQRASLCSTCDQLRSELAQRGAEALANDAAASESAADETAAAGLHAKEIQQLKSRNAELQRQLAEVRSTAPQSQEVLDWESEKRRILAVLECDLSEEPLDATNRLEIEDVVRRTDQIIAEQAREIEKLQHLLETQSDSLGSIAVGTAPLEQILDHDAIIREEREHLRQLQEQCREKLRQAEIQLSLERATIARREAEVEERLRLLEVRGKANDEPSDALCPTGHPVRGRWLAHLGLMESAEPRLPARREGDRKGKK